jgi:hypothetical protein
MINRRSSCNAQGSCGLPPRSVARCQLSAVEHPIKSQATFGNIVTAVYAAILLEIKNKGAAARFCKTERGKFALAQSR